MKGMAQANSVPCISDRCAGKAFVPQVEAGAHCLDAQYNLLVVLPSVAQLSRCL
jgi:hypothetical protein